MVNHFVIGDREPEQSSPYVIAEMGSNHHRDRETAKELINIAADAGVDAVKYQVYHTEDIVTENTPATEYGFNEYFDEETASEVYNNHLRLPREMLADLIMYADDRGLDNIASVTCPDCLAFTVESGVDALKIASQDLTHLRLLEAIGTYGLPIILSTGMGSLGEIETALKTLTSNGNDNVALLHCVSNYPTDPSDLSLGTIQLLRDTFEYITGFSDHSLSPFTGGLAVAQGAAIIEKHYTQSRELPGPDHPFALEPSELDRLVDFVEYASESVGHQRMILPDEEKRDLFRRSIVADRDIDRGEAIAESDLRLARPGTGLPPKRLEWIIGRTANRDIEREDVLTFEDIC